MYKKKKLNFLYGFGCGNELYPREREREREGGGEREREREREKQKKGKKNGEI